MRASWVLAALLLALPLLAGCGDEDEFVSEGTQDAPVALTYPVNARESNVGPESPSYYSVSGLSEQATYQVSVTEVLDDVDLFVFTQSSFTSTFCASGNLGAVNESCAGTTPVGVTQVYILVKPGITKTGTSFLLSVQ